MSSDNPFAVSPNSFGEVLPPDRDATHAEVTPRTIEMLNGTRPWVQLMGVLLWIGTVFLVLGSVGIIIASIFTSQPMLIAMGALYLVMAVVYGYLASSLTGYASRINALRASESVVDLERALESQKNFWRLIGIITLLFMGLYAVFIALMISGALTGLLPRM